MENWISVKDRLPECEQEVLIRAVRRYKMHGDTTEYVVITTAIYEDGKMSDEDSIWNWYDIEYNYDEKTDTNYLPEGWWEYRHYNGDDVYNNAVDDEVTHWMPLPSKEV